MGARQCLQTEEHEGSVWGVAGGLGERDLLVAARRVHSRSSWVEGGNAGKGDLGWNVKKKMGLANF